MRFIRILVLSVLLPVFAIGQENNIDTLLVRLPQLQGLARIDCLAQLSQGFFWMNTDSANLFAALAQRESQQLSYQKGLDISTYLMASVHMLRGHNATADTLFREAVQALQGYGDYYQAWCLLHHGFNLYNLGQFAESIRLMERSKPLMAKNDHGDGLAKVYTLLSLVYGAVGEYEKAFSNVTLSYAERLRTGNIVGMGYSLRMFAKIYTLVDDHKTAIEYYKRCLQLYRRSLLSGTECGEMAILYAGLGERDSAHKYISMGHALQPGSAFMLMYSGEVDAEEGRVDSAMIKLQEGLVRLRANKSYRIIPRILIDIGRLYLSKAAYHQAYQYAHEAFYISERNGARPTLSNASELLANTFEKMGRKDSAYYYLTMFTGLRESLMNDQFKAKLFGFNNSLEDERKQATITLLRKENIIRDQQLKNAGLIRTILIVGILIILALCFFIFRNVMLARKNVQLEAEQLRQRLQVQQMAATASQSELQRKAEKLELKALRAQMNPHFIFNCLSSINRFILINEREAASDYLTKFSRLIRMALQHSEQTLVTLEKELEMLKLYLELERLRFKNAFSYAINIPASLDTSTIFLPPLLLQPFAENAIWHGLMHKQGDGHLSITLQLNGNMLICNITDDGVGRSFAAMHQSKSVEKSKSMGMQITRERLHLFNNKVAVEPAIDIEDMVDEKGQPSGTKVLLNIHYRDLMSVGD
jgi:tetratricopeptide (TPR) repeat protein